jgi:uncharacterized protein YndB with AHSA1/START domain
MYHVETKIDASSSTVWHTLTDFAAWKEWWGAAPSRISPGWQSGATMEFGSGEKIQIPEVVEGTSIRMRSPFEEWYFTISPLEGGASLRWEFGPITGQAGLSDQRGYVEDKRNTISALKRTAEKLGTNKSEQKPEGSTQMTEQIPATQEEAYALLKRLEGPARSGPDLGDYAPLSTRQMEYMRSLGFSEDALGSMDIKNAAYMLPQLAKAKASEAAKSAPSATAPASWKCRKCGNIQDADAWTREISRRMSSRGGAMSTADIKRLYPTPKCIKCEAEAMEPYDGSPSENKKSSKKWWQFWK